MPATMLHLLAAKTLWYDAPTEFFAGSVLPDCVDSDRVLKDRIHFRDIPPEERLGKLTAFGRSLDLSDPYRFGIFFHLFLDREWDNGPQALHRASYRGDHWFSDYRREISLGGSYIAHTNPWVHDVWVALIKEDPEKYTAPLGFSVNDIKSFIDFNYKWHTEVNEGPSEFFTPEITSAFVDSSVGAFRAYMKENFPAVVFIGDIHVRQL